MGGHFRKDFYIFFVPRKSLLCEKRLKVSDIGFFVLIIFKVYLPVRTSPFLYSYMEVV